MKGAIQAVALNEFVTSVLSTVSQNEYEQRTFFSCEICNIVYAGFEKPPICHNCGNDTFIKVVPTGDAADR
ncbi:hypothetical protein [Saliphagus sp. LR7]|uniref:Uncharacterized protein n=1 Tax=Saliphagus infecundisoli TaxID=1849069 RepID=A0ABD5QK79_9EURY|nr:hypothetical protein [Saliphagus sp. LR7]